MKDNNTPIPNYFAWKGQAIPLDPKVNISLVKEEYTGQPGRIAWRINIYHFSTNAEDYVNDANVYDDYQKAKADYAELQKEYRSFRAMYLRYIQSRGKQ